MKKSLLLSLMLFANMAQAHVGHEHTSLMDGLAHPLGFDHLLAMLTVGLWSARTFKGLARFYAPVLFVTTLVLGAVLAHASGIEFASAETLIAASVVAFGALLIFTQIPSTLGFALIAAAGLVHGWAHGLEATAGGVFAMYVAGFVLSTAALHWVGVLAGSRLLHARVWLWHALGLAMGMFGAYALASI